MNKLLVIILLLCVLAIRAIWLPSDRSELTLNELHEQYRETELECVKEMNNLRDKITNFEEGESVE